MAHQVALCLCFSVSLVSFFAVMNYKSNHKLTNQVQGKGRNVYPRRNAFAFKIKCKGYLLEILFIMDFVKNLGFVIEIIYFQEMIINNVKCAQCWAKFSKTKCWCFSAFDCENIRIEYFSHWSLHQSFALLLSSNSGKTQNDPFKYSAINFCYLISLQFKPHN